MLGKLQQEIETAMCEANRHSTPDGGVRHARSRGPVENLQNVQAKILERKGSHINQ